MKKRFILISLFLSNLALLGGCGGSNNTTSGNSSYDYHSYGPDIDSDDESFVDGNSDENSYATPGFSLDETCPDVVQGGAIFYAGTYSPERNTCTWSSQQSSLTCPIAPGECTMCLYRVDWNSCEMRDMDGHCLGNFDPQTTCLSMGSTADLKPVSQP